ncbi:MAG: NYN domain-containing protein [Hyphomicrobiaceae bacterium]
MFVDYDNIYLSLKRRSEEAAKRFAKDAGVWIKAIETGSLITPTNGPGAEGVRRIVMNRCYGNPVPRRNQSDNATDMSSFPFVRHHFLRAGCEIVDCPPLTAQLKNSSDIRMVMDVRDYLTHDTYFDEFIILSGDADFTPLLHRLRAHARRTVVYANDFTAAPYTAICDGEIREASLISLLLEGKITSDATAAEIVGRTEPAAIDTARKDIIADVATAVRAAPMPVPLEVLADRAIRNVGHERTIGTSWGGAGGFRELLVNNLPEGMKLSAEPPYVVIDTARHSVSQPAPLPQLQAAPPVLGEAVEPRLERALPPVAPQRASFAKPAPKPASAQPAAAAAAAPARAAALPPAPPAPPAAPSSLAPMNRARAQESAAPAAPARAADQQSAIHQSIARIQEACQAPPLAPPEYRMLFEAMSQEINDHGLIGTQTILNITARMQERGIDLRRDDVRFVLEVVSEADPWFEQGVSANLFAGRFRNFVVARCRSQGLNLSADELDLIEAWFAGSPATAPAPRATQPAEAPPAQPVAREAASQPAQRTSPPEMRYMSAAAASWPVEEPRQQVAEPPRYDPEPSHHGADMAADDFPRIVRTRLRG